MRSACWIDIGMHERFFQNITCIDIFKSCNLFTYTGLMDLNHLPSKHEIDSSFLGFFTNEFICIWEFDNLFVWGPILNSSIIICSTLLLILSQKVLVVKSIEVISF